MSAPDVPSNPSPAHGARNVDPSSLPLTWTAPGATFSRVHISVGEKRFRTLTGLAGVGIEADGIWTFDRNSGGAASGGLFTLPRGIGVYWQVEAFNADGTTLGPLWEFVTAPPAPVAVGPANASTDAPLRPTVAWSAPWGCAFDVYFGDTNPPPLLETIITGMAFNAGDVLSFSPASDLAQSTTYYWQVRARSSSDEIDGPVWSFKTLGPPDTPVVVAPADGAVDTSTEQAIAWSAAGATSYDVYFGTSNPPPLVASGFSATVYRYGHLALDTSYYWKIIAINILGSAASSVFSFTTTAVEEEDVVTVLTTTSTGTQNDFNPGSLGNINVLRCNNASLLTISGLANGIDGQLLYIESVGAGQVDIANQASGSSAANRVINGVTGTISLSQGVGRALLAYDGTANRWRVLQHEQGAWIDVPFNAGDFTASAGSWGVDAGDVGVFRYSLDSARRTAVVALTLVDTSVSATPSFLKVAIPAGLIPTGNGINFARVNEGSGAEFQGPMTASAAGFFFINKVSGGALAPFATLTNITTIEFVATIEVQ
jgi:hypothetical protein